MKFVRFQHQEVVKYGILEEEQVCQLEGDPFGEFQRTDHRYPWREVKLLAPCQPSKVVAVGLNYRDHAQESGMQVPDEPVLFMKPATAVIGPEDPIIIPRGSTHVDYEAEFAIVIKSKIRNVSEQDALSNILGYTCCNDVSERTFQKKDGQWTRAKSFDTFCPLGPVIASDIDPHNLSIALYLNGERKQYSNTNQLVFGAEALVSFVSGVMTLLPGDVITTGTPAGVGPIKPGDVVEVEVEGIGVLRNPVAAEGISP